jgi:hypothetical protein
MLVALLGWAAVAEAGGRRGGGHGFHGGRGGAVAKGGPGHRGGPRAPHVFRHHGPGLRHHALPGVRPHQGFRHREELRRHHGFRQHHGFHGKAFIGIAPLFVWPPSYVYVPPVVAAPPVYVEPTGYWYYCPSAQAYYPYVATCPEAWIPVPAR